MARSHPVWKTREWRQIRARALKRNPGMAPHGKLSTYTNYACRCDLCMQARAEYWKDKKK